MKRTRALAHRSANPLLSLLGLGLTDPTTARAPRPSGGPGALIALCGLHTQLDAPLQETLILLANQGERIAVIVADNHFDAYAVARGVKQAEHLVVARGETPLQIQHLVQRVLAKREAYSIAVIVGLLETFYDEQVNGMQAHYLLSDTLRLLHELAHTMRVLVLTTPPPKPTRPQLKARLMDAADSYTELPALNAPQESPQRRLL